MPSRQAVFQGLPTRAWSPLRIPVQGMNTSKSVPNMKRSKANAIDKALIILACFLPYNKEMGTVEINQRPVLHKATASRTLWAKV
jgi:hypothetical protein